MPKASDAAAFDARDDPRHSRRTRPGAPDRDRQRADLRRPFPPDLPRLARGAGSRRWPLRSPAALAVHSRILRSELVAACPVIFALMILIAIGRRAHVARPLGMVVAAALCMRRAREQGAGDPPDRRAAAPDPAVRKRGKSRAWLSGKRPRAGLPRPSPRSSPRQAPGRRGRCRPPASTAPCSMPRNSIRSCSTVSASIRPHCWR